MVKQLIYKSECTSEITSEMVEAILLQAQRFNRDHNITGILLFSENTFLQFIEGAPQDIDRLYQRICDDTRHERLYLLYTGYADERAYPEWRMAACSTDYLLQQGHSQSHIFASELMEGETEKKLLNIGEFMKSFCDDFLPDPRPDRSFFN